MSTLSLEDLGITEEELPEIATKFQQVSKLKEKKGSTSGISCGTSEPKGRQGERFYSSTYLH